MIFAAGKSSRFGGFPKAFCDLGQGKNVENTIALARKHFTDIYLVVNEETCASGITNGLEGTAVVSIVTGQGDADSILKGLRRIVNKAAPDIVTACWGDAVFLSGRPFEEMKKARSAWDPASPVLVGCSRDRDPYAWFDTEGRKIVRSHFRKREPDQCDAGLHDQSVFTFRTELLLDYLGRYKHHLGLDVYDENTYDATRGEMGLLDAFTWFYGQPDMAAAEYCELTPGRVLSFNTQEDFDSVKRSLQEFRKRIRE